MTHRRNRQQWRKIINEQRQSGLSIVGFCREQGIREKRFHYWQRRLKVSSVPQQPAEVLDTDSSFIEMSFEKPEMPTVITLRHGRLSIELFRGFDKTCLTQILSVLEEST